MAKGIRFQALILFFLLAATTPVSATPRLKTPPAPPRSLEVTGPLLIRAIAARASAHSFEVHWTGQAGYLDVEHDLRALEAEPTVDALGGGSFRVTFHTRDDIPEGLFRGTLSMRVCSESPCVHALPGARAQRQLRVHLAWADGPDWNTWQGNAAHDGHMPLAVDPRGIRLAWRRDFPPGTRLPLGQQLVTSESLGFLSLRNAKTPGSSLIALDLANGEIRWQHDFTDDAHAPATADGRVHVATTGTSTRLWSFDAVDGTGAPLGHFDVLRTRLLAPTIADGVVYVNGGEGYRQGVHAFDAVDGLPLWTGHIRIVDGTTPAVADGRVYHYDQDGLHVFDAFDGTLLGTIEDPLFPFVGPGYEAAPLRGSTDHVLAFSGGDSDAARRLVNYAPSRGSVRWASDARYLTAPATTDGVVYAGSEYNGDRPSGLDALDEASGAVLGRWRPEGEYSLVTGNVVATRNLVFVGTTLGTHAIDRGTMQQVWSVPLRGHLAISGEGLLSILSATSIHAYSLRGR